MYSFAQRKDTMVVDEPLYAHYLRITNADHPGKDEIIQSMESDGKRVVEDIIFGDYSADIVFFKQMTHHLVDIDESFLQNITNVFLIRDPLKIIFSFSKVIDKVGMNDIGVKKQYELYNQIKDSGKTPHVIDSAEILKNPGTALEKLCNVIDIPFDDAMLSWKAGPRKEDGVWAKYWYANVHKSTGFGEPEDKERTLNSELSKLYEECLPYYHEMKKHSIIV